MKKKLSAIFWDTQPRALLTGVALFLAVSTVDFYLRNEISIDVFYFLPIFVFTWRGSRRWGLLMSAASVVFWLLDERIFAPDLAETYRIVAWNAAVRLAFFYIIVLLVDQIKTLVARERANSALKSAMIHTVSHEFNNALTGLSAGLFLLKETDGSAGDDTRSRLYGSMETSQHKLALYVKNILNEARMEGGRFKLVKKPLALRDLAAGIIDSIAELLNQKEIEIVTELPETPSLVNVDREALALVISNLLGNAVKYTRKGGRIKVKIERPEGAGVIFSVEDSGIGISLADLENIMSGFYRTEDGKSEASGFGLGLKISNELLQLHGSRLQIISEKGKGSRFFFELPVI